MDAKPRCRVACYNEDTHAIERCARWADHTPEDAHSSYQEVLIDMYEGLCTVRNIDPERVQYTMQGLTLALEAKAWYRRLVTE